MREPTRVTVGELIKSLERFADNPDAPVEIEIKQYNKRYPIAYVEPTSYGIGEDARNFANKRDGETVRISVHLPNNMRTAIYKNRS